MQAVPAQSLSSPMGVARPVNIFHCCVHKSGSQWIRGILADRRTQEQSGLRHYTYQKDLPGGFDGRKLAERTFERPFPRNTIISPLYIPLENFAKIPKPEEYRAFFVMRDPRDVVVSWYFSRRYSHVVTERAKQFKRDVLNEMSLEEGLAYAVDYLEDFGIYRTLDSWVGAEQADPSVALFKYEELSGPDGAGEFRRLFAHCRLDFPEEILRQLLEDYSFKQLSGRDRGEEDRSAHYRKGVAGDWQNYFTPELERRFREITGGLLARLGYEQGPR